MLSFKFQFILPTEHLSLLKPIKRQFQFNGSINRQGNYTRIAKCYLHCMTQMSMKRKIGTWVFLIQYFFQVHSSLDFKKTFSDERRLKIGATDTPWLQYNLIL